MDFGADGVDGMAMFQASQLNNEGNRLSDAGKFVESEVMHLEALKVKTEAGASEISIALTRNALGELYLDMNRVDDAKEMLEKAYAVREPVGDVDASYTRDNLGRMWEMRGDFDKAYSTRTAHPGRVFCTNYSCPHNMAMKYNKAEDLNRCARCKCALYCGKACQKKDWKRHKAFCRQV